MTSLPKPKPKASGTAGCEKIVGIRSQAAELSIHFHLTRDTLAQCPLIKEVLYRNFKPPFFLA